MLFPSDFWGGADMFGRVPVGGSRGQYFLFYSYSHISGGHLSPRLGIEGSLQTRAVLSVLVLPLLYSHISGGHFRLGRGPAGSAFCSTPTATSQVGISGVCIHHLDWGLRSLRV